MTALVVVLAVLGLCAMAVAAWEMHREACGLQTQSGRLYEETLVLLAPMSSALSPVLPPAGGSAEYHHCRHCLELIEAEPRPGTLRRGWAHVRTRVGHCEDSDQPGIWAGTIAAPLMPLSDDQCERLAAELADVAAIDSIHEHLIDAGLEQLVLCRNCRLPIEPATLPTSSPLQHTGTGALGCWIDGAREGRPADELFGLLAEPVRTCAECGVEESPRQPLVGSTFGSTDKPPATAWYCAIVPDCRDRKAARSGFHRG